MCSCARLFLLFLGLLLVSLYQQVDLSLLGHVDISEPTLVWNTLGICPTGLSNDKTTGDKLLSVMGKGSELSFTVQIAEDASEIALDQPHTVNVQGDEVFVFQFISSQGISDKQLDITATSQSEVAAYLKVSQDCKEVAPQKDQESRHNKNESLRLSFATKGRITLSRVSIPPLTDSVSRWFIGIGLKNLPGDVKRSESKSVTLKLSRSFDYTYTTPICVLFFVSLVVGILVSIIAYFLFEGSLTQLRPGNGRRVLTLRISYCDLREVIRSQWGSFDSKTYFFVTGIMVCAYQLVFEEWDKMIQEGDRDKCYYNDFCYKVANHDIPFNLMISNLPYIVHGLILIAWVLMLETKVKRRCENGRNRSRATALRKRYSFSIAYAFSWALVCEGFFSAFYHLCPNRFTFQIDSAVMFIIASLNILLLHNGIDQKRSSSSEIVKHPIDAYKFFLTFNLPLSIFNYFGERFNTNRLNKVMQWLFFVSLIIWWSMMYIWAFRVLNIYERYHSTYCRDKFKCFLFFLSYTLCLMITIYLFNDLPQAFLLACAVCNISAICAKFLEKLNRRSSKVYVEDIGKGFLIFLTVFIWVVALAVFLVLPTTNKISSPENSRDLNQECAIFGFFDWHDLWHFSSSLALLMGAFVTVFLSS